MSNRYGTHNFVSITAAILYYAAYDHDRESVMEKLAAGEISIGEPDSIPSGASFRWDEDGRGEIDYGER